MTSLVRCLNNNLLNSCTQKQSATEISLKPRQKLNQVVDDALDAEHLKQIIERNALASDDDCQGTRIREEMEEAEAKKLQPFSFNLSLKKPSVILEGS